MYPQLFPFLCIYAFYDGIFLCLFLYAFSSCGGDCDGGLCGGDRDGGNGGGGGDHLYLVGRTLHCIREGLENTSNPSLQAKRRNLATTYPRIQENSESSLYLFLRHFGPRSVYECTPLVLPSRHPSSVFHCGYRV